MNPAVLANCHVKARRHAAGLTENIHRVGKLLLAGGVFNIHQIAPYF